MVRKRAKKAAKRVDQEASGTYRRSRNVVESFTLDRVLPNSIASLIGELLALIPRALGRGSARQQIYASITMIILAIISSPFTLGYSLLVALPFVLTLLVGIVRIAPTANETFARLRGNRLRDRDVPLWSRD